MNELQTVDLKDVEIFATGVHNDMAFSTRDLDDIAENTMSKLDEIQPFAKIEHDEDQSVVTKTGYPSAGWISNIRRVKNKLLADIKGVPRQLANIIQKGGFKRLSSELVFNWKDSNGTVWNKVLIATAFLGNNWPAVRTLADIEALYASYPQASIHKFTFGDNIMSEIKEEQSIDDAVEVQEEQLTIPLEQSQPKEKPQATVQVQPPTPPQPVSNNVSAVTDETLQANFQRQQANYLKLQEQYERTQQMLAETLRQSQEEKVEIFLSGLKTERALFEEEVEPVRDLLHALQQVDAKVSYKDKDGNEKTATVAQRFCQLIQQITTAPARKTVYFGEMAHAAQDDKQLREDAAWMRSVANAAGITLKSDAKKQALGNGGQ